MPENYGPELDMAGSAPGGMRAYEGPGRRAAGGWRSQALAPHRVATHSTIDPAMSSDTVGSVNRYALLTAALAATLATVVPAAPALAHTELKSTTPAAKSTATEPVTEVTLTFSGLIRKPGTTVTVTGPDKASYSAGDAQVLDRTITQKVDPLPVGAVTVEWRTTAADGHALRGSFTFTNEVAPPTPTAEPSPTAAPATEARPPAAVSAAPAGQAGDEESGSSGVAWAVAAVAVLAVAALGGLLWRRRRQSGT